MSLRRMGALLGYAALSAAAVAPATAVAAGELPVTPNTPGAFQGPSLAVHPTRPQRVAIAFQDGITLKTCYLALSDDGGHSWRTTALAGAGARFPLADSDVCWRPSLAYAPNGTLHYVFQTDFVSRKGGHGVKIMSSSDGGDTFPAPRNVFPQGDAPQNFPAVGVDPRNGRVYVAWTLGTRDPPTGPHAGLLFSGTLQVASSDDGGRTFAPPVEPQPLHRELTHGSLLGVAGDGSLYLAYSTSAPTADAPDPSRRALVFAASSDGGQSFGTRTIDAQVPLAGGGDELAANGMFRLFALAPGRTSGEVYLAWWRRPAERARVVFSASRDGGASWTTRQTIGIGPGNSGHHQFRPWLAVEPSGRIHAVLYDRDGLEGPQHFLATFSDDGGRSFSAPARMTGVASDSQVGPTSEITGGFVSFGDFPAAAAARGGLIAAWTDSRRGTRLNAKQDVFAAGPATTKRSFRLSVRPRRVRAGALMRFVVRARLGRAPLPGVTVRFAGRRLRTRKNGRARITVRLRHPGRIRVRARKTGFASAGATVRVIARCSRCRKGLGSPRQRYLRGSTGQ